jgi:hypothetical protein
VARDLSFAMAPDFRHSCATCLRFKYPVRRTGDWVVSYIEGIVYPKPKKKYLCLRHAAAFALKHGGGKIDLSMFNKVFQKKEASHG